VASRRLEVIIAGDAKGAKDAFDSTEKGAESLGSRMTSTLGTAGKAIGLAAVAGVVGVGFALKGAWEAAEESAKIARETERVIKTTGGAANVSAEQVSDLATRLSDLTGVDDELIQSTENLMLTFTNVKDVAGAGNDVFTQSIGLGLDMATALGTDASDAAIQLGKALNDPIKGITALSRSGVSFTEQQKEQIKTLVKSGDVLGAQKIILGELAKEFGGAAAAAGTPLDKLKVQIGNFQEAVGAQLIPIVNAVATWLGERLPLAINWLSAKWEEFKPTFEAGMKAIGDAASSMGDSIKNALEWLTRPENDAALKAVAATIGTALVFAFVALGVAAWTAAAGVAAALWPFLLIAAAVGALVFALIKLWENWDTLRNVVGSVVTWLQATVPPIFDAVRQAIVNFYTIALAPMIGYITANSEAFANIGKVLLVLVGIIVGIVVVAIAAFALALLGIVAVIAVVAVALVALIAVLYNLVQTVWDVFNNVRQALGQAIDHIEETIQAFWDLAQNVGSAIATAAAFLDGLISAAGRVAAGVIGKLQEVDGAVRALPGQIASAIGNLGSILFGAGQAVVQGLINGIASMGGALSSRVASIVNSIPEWARGLLGIGSPSKVMMEIGMFAGLGLAEGIEQAVPAVDASSSRLAVAPPAATATASIAGATRSGDYQVHIHLTDSFVGDEERLGKEISRQLVVAERQGARMPWAS
jgi:hypothetical protein